MEVLTVGIGRVCAAAGAAELTAYAIGSCIALCLCDPVAQVGAMAHILLPSASYTGHGNLQGGADVRYANHALAAALSRMEELGAERRRIIAAIVGGAAMFTHGSMPMTGVGRMNTESVRQELEREQIPLAYECVGGHRSRTVVFRTQKTGFEQQLEIRMPQIFSA